MVIEFVLHVLILQSLGKIQLVGSKSIEGLTALELTGTDRVGLLSEIFAVLSDLQVNVVESKVWTHNGRIAALIYVKDCDSGFPIEDELKIDTIEAKLRNVLKGDNDIRSAKTLVSLEVTHTERRLHQMMFADRDYEQKPIIRTNGDSPIVSIQNCMERGYSGVNVHCKDRAKLLFDVVCTLTDMEYVVFHATLDTTGDRAYMVCIHYLHLHFRNNIFLCLHSVNLMLFAYFVSRNSSLDILMGRQLVQMLKSNV